MAALLAKSSAAQAALAAALANNGAAAQAPKIDPASMEPWLTAEQLSQRMPSVFTAKWLWRNKAKLPFARKLSRKKVMFSLPGAQQYLATRKA